MYATMIVQSIQKSNYLFICVFNSAAQIMPDKEHNQRYT